MSLQHVVLFDRHIGPLVHSREGVRTIDVTALSYSGIFQRLRDVTEPVPNQSMTYNPMRHRSRQARAPVPVLSIMCHGVRVDLPNVDFDFFLDLGVQGITPSRASAFGMGLRGHVTEKIRMLVCNAALTDDGKTIMSRIAVGAGVPVFASAARQAYTLHYGRYVDFGPWEGDVYRFDPSGDWRIAFSGPSYAQGLAEAQRNTRPFGG
ncbi:MAG: hypothetical protein AAF943_02940 [Pseudomonadota bacterium]